MAAWIDKEQELDLTRTLRDTRPLSAKFGAWLAKPQNYVKFNALVAGVAIIIPALATIGLAILLLGRLWYGWQLRLLPIRYPKDMPGLDPSTRDDTGAMQESPGILFLGNERSQRYGEGGSELWASNSDARTHMLMMGTTGAGKTQALLSIAYNALAWSSGFFYSDGKADNSLWAYVFSMCRRLGRDDDLLVINFMTGGADPFQRGLTSERLSNGMNPYTDASADSISQLMSSLLPKAEGDSATWQQKAINMMDAAIRALTYLRAKGEVDLSVSDLRQWIALPKLIELYLRRDLPEAAYMPIKSYLETGLPGFNPNKARAGDPQDQGVLDQHGYMTGQYARTLGMLMDTYGYIFKARYSEVDMMDVMLNNRILVVMIPTMEKSEQEAANLGKLVVSSMRLMMAQNLGNKLEGYYDDVIASKATNAPEPYIVIMDELGYYFAQGIAVMFAQARSLGFMMLAAGQDVPAMMKGETEKEAKSMIANTKFKASLALEDPEETYELFKKAAGEAQVTEISGFQGGINALTSWWGNMFTASIDKQDRIKLQELKALGPGQGVMIWMDKVIRYQAFSVFSGSRAMKESREIPFRVNRFIQVEKTAVHDIAAISRPISTEETRVDKVLSILRARMPPAYPAVDDRVFKAMHQVIMAEDESGRQKVAGLGATERGIVLYCAAIEALKQMHQDGEQFVAEASGGSGGGHKPKITAPDADIATTVIPEQQLAADDYDALAFLNDPPIEEKLVSSDKSEDGDESISSEQDDASAEIAPAPTPTTEQSDEDWAGGAVVEAAPFEEGAETVIGFKEDVADKLVSIERLLGSDSPQTVVQESEREVAQSLEWSGDTEITSEEDIEKVFNEIASKFQRKRN